jgi:hypothetical protein
MVEGLKTMPPPPGLVLPMAPLALGEFLGLFTTKKAPTAIAAITRTPTRNMAGLTPDRAAATGAAGCPPQACGWP